MTFSWETGKNGPRSGEWCDMFGVITRENLSNGIIEKRQDGSLVVYRQFRRDPGLLTPFGLFFPGSGNSVSQSDLMASLLFWVGCFFQFFNFLHF